MRAETTSGPVEGLEHDGLLQFRGVPYAASTGGANRFRPPIPPEPWTTPRPATEHGAIAPQASSALESMLGAPSRTQGEECLHVTITTPGLDGARPVMVWIHGGAYQTGSPGVPWYDGRRLAARGDVVVVAVGYRLGVLGYLRLEHLLGDEFAGSGNLGLVDQVAALEWVRDNVAFFGGDPDRVTVFGESAGAMSVGTLLGTPSASGLFGRAIAQSGACHHVSSPDEAAEAAEAVLSHLDGGAEALLTASTEVIVAAQEAAAPEILRASPTGLRLPFQPWVDGAVLPRPPLEAVRSGAAAGVDLLTGTTADEWALFHLQSLTRGPLDEEALLRRAERVFGDRAFDAVEVYRSSRPGASPDQLWVAIGTDVVFRIPAVRMAEAAGEYARTWMYWFTHASPQFGGVLGSCHAIEIPFVFDNLDRGGVETLVGPLTEPVRALAAATSAAWAGFAREGDPSRPELGPWDPYGPDTRAVMELGRDPGLHHDPAAAERELFDDLAAYA